ncbi:HAD family phosphatase [Microlunatus panaciterrae]|uniref:HAD superfamily hydrolase (TIGR01509 family) n=1 Tax=Microlunatus panaciterrae TaxID=400768 RepID=A0ABS2RE13_9ACTN|nr:HAD family phosphatase [Microlunatus panaciterrae]MBM7797241.1 HAD superfamily hydrolase (TIGR01509 family) [Microlunatus panaciterrae]
MTSEPNLSNVVTSGTALSAALWDFDGTLADTEPLWVAAEFELVEGLGASWDEAHAEQLVGNSLLDSGAYILEVIGRQDLTPAWVVEQLLGRVVEQLRSRPIPWRPGALELLASFGEAGIPCALVSASYRVLLEAVFEQLPDGAFTVSVAGDEVSRGKPHPEPYLSACAKLGVHPTNCVVFEDSSTGARAGNAAGALVLAVENLVPIPPAPNRLHIPSLAELDAGRVAALLDGWHGA